MSACWSGGTWALVSEARARINSPARARREVMTCGPREGCVAGGMCDARAICGVVTILIPRPRQINRPGENSASALRRLSRPVVELLLPVQGQVALEQGPLLALDAPELLPAVQKDCRVVRNGDDDDEEQKTEDDDPVDGHRLDELLVLGRVPGLGVLLLERRDPVELLLPARQVGPREQPGQDQHEYGVESAALEDPAEIAAVVAGERLGAQPSPGAELVPQREDGNPGEDHRQE